MDDLISRKALKKAIMNDLGLGDEENGSDAEYISGLQDCYTLIDNAKPMDEKISKYIKSQIEYWTEKAINYRFSWEHYYARGRRNSLEEILKYMEADNEAINM